MKRRRKQEKEKYTLQQSLALYKKHLNDVLQDEDALCRFLEEIGSADALGCFCDPDKDCHVDAILEKLRELRELRAEAGALPIRQSVKVKYLRPKFDNLREWLDVDGHILCTRHGRIFIHDKSSGSKDIFHYQKSEWHNPYPVKK